LPGLKTPIQLVLAKRAFQSVELLKPDDPLDFSAPANRLLVAFEVDEPKTSDFVLLKVVSYIGQ